MQTLRFGSGTAEPAPSHGRRHLDLMSVDITRFQLGGRDRALVPPPSGAGAGVGADIAGPRHCGEVRRAVRRVGRARRRRNRPYRASPACTIRSHDHCRRRHLRTSPVAGTGVRRIHATPCGKSTALPVTGGSRWDPPLPDRLSPRRRPARPGPGLSRGPRPRARSPRCRDPRSGPAMVHPDRLEDPATVVRPGARRTAAEPDGVDQPTRQLERDLDRHRIVANASAAAASAPSPRLSRVAGLVPAGVVTANVVVVLEHRVVPLAVEDHAAIGSSASAFAGSNQAAGGKSAQRSVSGYSRSQKSFIMA